MKPRVNNDDPLVANASLSGGVPVPQKMPVNPARTATTHVAGSDTNDSGAYSDSTRSRVSNGRVGPAKRLNNLRIATKCVRVIDVITALGTTTVLRADSSVQITRNTPATTATTWNTITRLLCHTPSR